MIDNFRGLVLKMRTAQKKYFRSPSAFGLEECKRLELRVDKWLERNAQDQVKLQSYAQGKPLVELPGIYNVRDETETDEGGAA